MQIDNCGKNSEKLMNVYSRIMDANSKEKNNGKNPSAEELDEMLYIAYKRMLGVTGDMGVIAISLNNLEKMVEIGRIEIADIGNIAEHVVRNTIKEEVPHIDFDGDNLVTQAALETGIILADELIKDYEKPTEFDNNLINTICTEKMQEYHKNTYENAKNGNKDSVMVLNLINKATNYMAVSEKLNPKGKEAGALALISQLIQTGDKEAEVMAENLVKHFGIESVLENGQVDIDKVKNRFEEIKPGHKLDDTFKRLEESSIKNKDKILERSSDSITTTVQSIIERKHMREFDKALGKVLEEGDIAAAEILIESNLELAKKSSEEHERIYESFIKGKKSENEKFKSRRMILSSTLRRISQTQIKNPDLNNTEKTFLHASRENIEALTDGTELER